MIADILEGADPATMAVKKMSDMSIYVNTDTANEIGVEIPNAVLEKATTFPQ